MRINKLFFTLLAVSALFAGCKDPEPEPTIPSLVVAQTELSFEQGGGTASVTVTSNRPWSITSDADWLAFNPSEGQASDSPVNVTVTALANTSNDRTSSFRVKTDFDYKTVTVSQKGSKGEDPNVTPTGKGTLEDPYNVIAAINAVKDLTWTSNSEYQTTGEVYVKGKISRISENGTFTDGGSFGNASFFISADGSSTNEFQVYRCLYLGNKKYKSGQTDIKVGDEVIICGKLMNYKGNTPETDANNAYVYSLNGVTGGQGGDEPEPKGTGTLEDPYNPAGAAAAAKVLTWTSNDDYQTTDDVYVKGKISSIADKGTYTDGGTYGNASFFISEDGEQNGEFQVYRALYLGNKKFESGQTDIKVGDEVIIYGKLMNYKGNTPETVSGKAYLYSLNGETGGSGQQEDYSKAEAKTVADFISAADKNTYFKLTGTVSGFNSKYCSFDLEDASGKIYVYSVANKDEWSSKISNGGTVTLAGKYDYYADKSQHEVVSAQILSFEAAAPQEAEEATVAEALEAENDALLKVGPAVVVASSDAGFLMEQEGAMIYVYGEKAKVGDNVTVEADRSEYQGVPQLANPKVTVNSEGTEVSYPEPKDISSSVDSYTSSTREYVTFTGTLSISNGKYFNITVEGASSVTGSIVKPLNDISALDGKEVTVTGYYLYHTGGGKYLYVIATSVKATDGTEPEPEPEPQPGGDTPEVKTVTVKEFLAAEDSKTQPYQLTGKVSNIASTTYGNFDLTDETGTVYVYGLVSKDLGGYDPNKANDKSFASIGINEGDVITIVGFRETFTNDSGSKDEVAGSYYVSGASGQGEDPGGDEPGGDTPADGSTVSWNAAGDWKGVSDQAETISYTIGGYTITATKASGKTKPTVNSTYNDCRVYAAGTVTVTTTGDAMTSIVFNISSQGQKRLTEITANVGSVAKQNKGDKTVSWSGSAKSVTFTVGEKAVYGSDGDSKAGQFDFSSVVIK